MLQNTSKTLSFKKIMVYETPFGGGGGGGGGKPYLARGLIVFNNLMKILLSSSKGPCI